MAVSHCHCIHLGAGHRLTVLSDMQLTTVYDLRDLLCPQSPVALRKDIHYGFFYFHVFNSQSLPKIRFFGQSVICTCRGEQHPAGQNNAFKLLIEHRAPMHVVAFGFLALDMCVPAAGVDVYLYISPCHMLRSRSIRCMSYGFRKCCSALGRTAHMWEYRTLRVLD